jgi:hypothetical protein
MYVYICACACIHTHRTEVALHTVWGVQEVTFICVLTLFVTSDTLQDKE